MKVLCVGDVVGKPGRAAIKHWLPLLREEFALDTIVVNAENAAGGAGITARIAEEVFRDGADVITLGDHTWDKRDAWPYYETMPTILRPHNFPEGASGKGVGIFKTSSGLKFAVINLLGRVFMRYNVNCPFRAADEILDEVRKETPIVILDMHAEATSEKVAIGHYLDGRVSCVFGTHTHIQTADEKILTQGTAYITDLGMTGPYDSVIGQSKERIIERFITSLPNKFEVAEGGVALHGIVVDIDEATGRALSIERVQRKYDYTAE